MKSINHLTHAWAQKQNITSHFKSEVDSTNTWAKKDFVNEEFALFLADHQTQGRGRNQNTWQDGAHGGTLLSTWCMHSPLGPQPVFPLRVGMALYEAFANTWPDLNFALKAPNDIYLAGGKLAGILVEVEQRGQEAKIFIGIGANIFTSPEALADKVARPTACLSNYVNWDDEDWELFCTDLSHRFKDMQEDAERSHLVSEEQDQLLCALKKHQGNQITAVESDGSLKLSDGTFVHWQNL